MSKHLKQVRFGTLMLRAIGTPGFFRQVHAVFGGTGAVGGAMVLAATAFFEEALRFAPHLKDDAPYFLLTGHTRREIRAFTQLLFGIHRRDHDCDPERLPGRGYRLASGVTIEMTPLSIEPTIPEMRNISRLDSQGRQQASEEFLHRFGLDFESPEEEKLAAVSQAIGKRSSQPFTSLLQDFKRRSGLLKNDQRFQSVVVTIPLASVATYQLGDLEIFAKSLGIETGGSIEELKDDYLANFPQDLATVAADLAHEVLVAHTTGIGGMYDESEDGDQTIRLGFAHSGSQELLRTKQLFAEKLTRLYSERGIRMLVTAAAIGIDAVLKRKALRIQPASLNKLKQAIRRNHDIVPAADLKGGTLRVYRPIRSKVFAPTGDEIRLSGGTPIIFDCVVKSGENGYFTVPNADALYRVMRVASASELGHVLARTAVFGDDPQKPRFVDNVCYYDETDYSRQVFDLLSQRPLQQNQLAGLQPKALQDLGSPKHQAELHTLGLLILLHRLDSLDLSGIEPHVELSYFDPCAYFESHSRPPTLEQAASWPVASLTKRLTELCSLDHPSDLLALMGLDQPYPERREAILRILEAVLNAVWAAPSLGIPILFEQKGRLVSAAGYFLAPFDQVQSHDGGILDFLHRRFLETRGRPASLDDTEFARFCEFHFANGFLDLRPQATLVTALRDDEDLEGKVQVFSNETDFLRALSSLTPYSYFTASGLIALSARLKGLNRQAGQVNFKLGTANSYRVHFTYDESGRALLTPGVVEAFRMVSEGLEKNTGSEVLDGLWGYGFDYSTPATGTGPTGKVSSLRRLEAPFQKE